MNTRGHNATTSGETRASASVPRAPLSASVLDLACLLFAAWTVACNAVVLASGRSAQLVGAALGLFAAALLALGFGLRTGKLRAAVAWLSDDDERIAVEPEDTRQPWPLVRLVALAIAGIIASRFDRHHDLSELSWAAMAYCALAYLAVAPSGRDSGAQPVRGARGAYELALWVAGLGCAGLTLALHRPDSDDAFYVNMAVTVSDFPHEALLSRDTLHGLNVPFKIAAYRAPSLELLAGVIAHVLHLRVLDVCHLVLPGIVGLLTPLALARLLRLLDPLRWPYAVLATLLYLLHDGLTHGSLGNFSFVRLFQGKAMFITMVAPLVMAHGLRFGLRPSVRSFAMLSLSQIAALGTTVTAFWAAPALAGMCVLAGAAPRVSAFWKTLLVGTLGSSYLLGLGLYFKLHEGGTAAVSALTRPSGAAAEQATSLVAHPYAMVLGHGRELSGAIALSLLTWPLCRTALGRRFAVALPLGFYALLANPLLANRVAMVTTPGIYWRVGWLLSIPLLFGLATSSLLARPSARGLHVASLAPFALALYLYFDLVSARTIFAKAAVQWPHPKVDMRAYRIAQELVARVPPHRPVLAPLAVSRVLPMLNGYGYPLFVKEMYLPSDPEDRKWRERITQFVSRRRVLGADERFFEDSLAHYGVRSAVVPEDHGGRHSFTHALTAAGFRKVGSIEGQGIWLR